MALTLDAIKNLREELLSLREQELALKKEQINLKYAKQDEKMTIKETLYGKEKRKSIATLKTKYKKLFIDNKKSRSNLVKEIKNKSKEYKSEYKATIETLKGSELVDYKCYSSVNRIKDFNDETFIKLSHDVISQKRYLTRIVRMKETHLVQYMKREALHDQMQLALNKTDYKLLKKDKKDAYKKTLLKTNDKKKIRNEVLIWHLIYMFGEWLQYRFKKQQLLVGRDIIVLFSCLSLAFSLNYIRAIKQVSSSVSAPLMFGFVLFGLISIFNVTRMKEALSHKFWFTFMVMLLTIGCGLGMCILCIIGMQANVKVNLIQVGLLTAAIIMIGYIIGLAFIFIARKKEKAQFKDVDLGNI